MSKLVVKRCSLEPLWKGCLLYLLVSTVVVDASVCDARLRCSVIHHNASIHCQTSGDTSDQNGEFSKTLSSICLYTVSFQNLSRGSSEWDCVVYTLSNTVQIAAGTCRVRLEHVHVKNPCKDCLPCWWWPFPAATCWVKEDDYSLELIGEESLYMYTYPTEMP